MLRLRLDAERPNLKKLGRIVDLLKGGGVVVYPTDSTYGLGCDVYMKRSVDRLYQLKGVERKHPFSFLCFDLAQVSRFALIDNRNYRILRKHTPGAFTFILPATKEVPRVLQSKRRNVGIRIPASPICRTMVEALGHPLVSTTLRNVDDGLPMQDPDLIEARMGRAVEGFVDVGDLLGEPSTVVDLTGEEPEIIRVGAGGTLDLGS